MKVRQYTCPECGYRKSPTTHLDCGGNIVRKDGTWQCDACGTQPTAGTVCTRCGSDIPPESVTAVEMELR